MPPCWHCDPTPPRMLTFIHTLNVCPILPLFSSSFALSLRYFSLSLSFLSSCLSVHPSLPPTDSSDSDLELSTVRHQPEGLDQLQAQTKFTRKELQSLYRGFKNVRPAAETFFTALYYYALYRLKLIWYLSVLSSSLEQECPSGMVDEETFKTIYSQFFPQGG